MIEWEFPEKLGFLFEPARFKVAYGGRDGGKSWSFARALLLLGAEKQQRILCAREVQKSIKDSVHKLLADQIQALGLAGRYEILQNEIRGANGTEIVFTGLSSQTRESIKSYEGIDICWVEEAQAVSRRSWSILTPTIRKDGSEIWVTFNPELDTDETYRRFVLQPQSDARVVKVNFYDNPWKSRALDTERAEMRAASPDEYGYIYEGNCRPAVEGAIYYREITELKSSGRLARVPHDPLLRTHTIWDLGWNDAMSILCVQRLGSEIRVIRYIEDRFRTLAEYDAELRALGYRWGKCYLPHDGRAKDYKSGKSAEEIMRALGWDIEIVESIGVEQGIRAARQIFPRVLIDQEGAGELATRLSRYRRRVNQQTGTGGTPLHDDESHGADGFRYLALVADQLSNDDPGKLIADPYAGFRRR